MRHVFNIKCRAKKQQRGADSESKRGALLQCWNLQDFAQYWRMSNVKCSFDAHSAITQNAWAC